MKLPMLALLAGGAFLLYKSGVFGTFGYDPTATEPIDWWFDTANGTLTFAPGIIPPSPGAPTVRPASESEIAAYNASPF